MVEDAFEEDEGAEAGLETDEERGFEDGISEISTADETGRSETGCDVTNCEGASPTDTAEEGVFAKADFVTNRQRTRSTPQYKSQRQA